MSGGGCTVSTFPIQVGNDKGDTEIYSFDYSEYAKRMALGGMTMDDEIRKYSVKDTETPLIMQYSTIDLKYEWGYTLQGAKGWRIDAIKYNNIGNVIFSHASHPS